MLQSGSASEDRAAQNSENSLDNGEDCDTYSCSFQDKVQSRPRWKDSLLPRSLVAEAKEKG